MAHIIIDRRKNSKGKSTVNRQRFIQRAKKQIKNAVKDHIRDGKIGDLISSQGKKIKIPIKNLDEPIFHHGKGGQTDIIHPGNKDFVAGDRLKRPSNGGGKGQGKNASNSPEKGSDAFEFHLTKEEFLELFLEDLELPDMLKKKINVIDHYEVVRSGFKMDGTPSQLDLIRSMKRAKGRRTALHGIKIRRLDELKNELKSLEDTEEKASEDEKENLKIEIEIIKKKIEMFTDKIPYIDDMDLRYRRFDRIAIPATQAIVFFIMDVSGSMGEWEKEMAKSFFLLMSLFLNANYKRVVSVFIRYHTEAKEVEEDEFYHSRETGGTTLAPALQLAANIIKERYPIDQWNIYACHVSDGDNFPEDTPKSVEILSNKLLPKLQYFAYVEIDKKGGKDSDLWETFEKTFSTYEKFNMNVITEPKDIYPVFRKLFEKRKYKDAT